MTVTENRLQPARGRAVLDREHQWKSCKTVSDVVSDRLSDLAFRSGVIEHVIRNLKGQPEPVAVDPQSLTLLCSQSTQQGADVAASLKQGRGVSELDGHCGGGQPTQVVVAAHRREEHQRRADPLSPGLEEVRHGTRHLGRVGLDLLSELCFEGSEVVGNRPEQLYSLLRQAPLTDSR